MVTASVCGMSATSKRSSPRAATVRLTPSSVTEPFSTMNGAKASRQREDEHAMVGQVAPLADGEGAVDVALHPVAPQRVAHAQRRLEVDVIAATERAEGGAARSVSGDELDLRAPEGAADDRQADAGDGEARAERQPRREPVAVLDDETHTALARRDRLLRETAALDDETREHGARGYRKSVAPTPRDRRSDHVECAARIPLSFVGTLDDLPFPDLLQALASGRKSGRLTLSSRQGHSVLLLRQGRIIYAASNSTRESLGLLVSRRFISEEMLQEALEIQHRFKETRRLGEIMLANRFVSPEALADVLRQQIEGVLSELLRWQGGFFKFDADDVPAQTAGEPEVDVGDFLLQEGFPPRACCSRARAYSTRRAAPATGARTRRRARPRGSSPR